MGKICGKTVYRFRFLHAQRALSIVNDLGKVKEWLCLLNYSIAHPSYWLYRKFWHRDECLSRRFPRSMMIINCQSFSRILTISFPTNDFSYFSCSSFLAWSLCEYFSKLLILVQKQQQKKKSYSHKSSNVSISWIQCVWMIRFQSKKKVKMRINFLRNRKYVIKEAQSMLKIDRSNLRVCLQTSMM